VKVAVIEVAGKELTVTNLDKVWWPQSGITKGDVIRYYVEIAPWLLPHLQNRPLVLTRYPDGYEGKSFYQKNTPAHAPEWLRTFPLQSDSGRIINYCLADDLADLIWIVNSGAFEIHPFLSRVATIEQPDYVVFDLDPMEKATWQHVCETALAIAKALELWGLHAFPKTSGSTGMQIFVPIKLGYTYEQVWKFALAICQAVQSVLPHMTTLERKIAKREGKLYLDYLQNGLGKTLATVYGVRPKPGATVSAPLTWEEVAEAELHPADFTINNILQRVRNMGDLFAPVQNIAQSLDHILEQGESRK